MVLARVPCVHAAAPGEVGVAHVEDLLGDVAGRGHHGTDAAEADRHERAVAIGKARERSVRVLAEVVEVADDR